MNDAVEARMRAKRGIDDAAAAAVAAVEAAAEAIRDKDLSVTTNPTLIVTTLVVEPIEDEPE